MAKTIKQYRYYNDGSTLNSPSGASTSDFSTGKIFDSDLIFPVSQLGIQGLPGTKFYLNNNSAHPMILGVTGIYDLEISNGAEVTSILFDKESLEIIDNTATAYLIVDVLYGEK